MSVRTHRALRTVAIACVLTVAQLAAAGQPLASVTSLEGRPEVFRDNRPLLVDIEPGLRFEAFDYLETDENTIVNLELLPRSTTPARMVIEPNTALVLMGRAGGGADAGGVPGPADGADTGPSGDARRAGGPFLHGETPLEIEVFTGSLAVSGASVIVRRPGVAIEATNADFSVVAGPGGTTLVISTDGIVSVVTDAGVQIFAEPGDAVEVALANDLTRIREYERATAGSFPLFWLAERRALLDSDIETHTQLALTRYQTASLAWEEAYATLIGEREVLDDWAEEDRRDLLQPVSLEALARLEPIMEEARTQFAAYQNAVAMVESLAEIQPVIVAEVSIPSGLDGAQALEGIAGERRQMDRWFWQTLYALKLFEERPPADGM